MRSECRTVVVQCVNICANKSIDPYKSYLHDYLPTSYNYSNFSAIGMNHAQIHCQKLNQIQSQYQIYLQELLQLQVNKKIVKVIQRTSQVHIKQMVLENFEALTKAIKKQSYQFYFFMKAVMSYLITTKTAADPVLKMIVILAGLSYDFSESMTGDQCDLNPGAEFDVSEESTYDTQNSQQRERLSDQQYIKQLYKMFFELQSSHMALFLQLLKPEEQQPQILAMDLYYLIQLAPSRNKQQQITLATALAKAKFYQQSAYILCIIRKNYYQLPINIDWLIAAYKADNQYQQPLQLPSTVYCGTKFNIRVSQINCNFMVEQYNKIDGFIDFYQYAKLSVKINHRSISSYHNLAVSLYLLEEYEQAEKVLQIVQNLNLKWNRLSYAIYNNIQGDIAMKLDKIDQAEQYYKLAMVSFQEQLKYSIQIKKKPVKPIEPVKPNFLNQPYPPVKQPQHIQSQLQVFPLFSQTTSIQPIQSTVPSQSPPPQSNQNTQTPKPAQATKKDEHFVTKQEFQAFKAQNGENYHWRGAKNSYSRAVQQFMALQKVKKEMPSQIYEIYRIYIIKHFKKFIELDPNIKINEHYLYMAILHLHGQQYQQAIKNINLTLQKNQHGNPKQKIQLLKKVRTAGSQHLPAKILNDIDLYIIKCEDSFKKLLNNFLQKGFGYFRQKQYDTTLRALKYVEKHLRIIQHVDMEKFNKMFLISSYQSSEEQKGFRYLETKIKQICVDQSLLCFLKKYVQSDTSIQQKQLTFGKLRPQKDHLQAYLSLTEFLVEKDFTSAARQKLQLVENVTPTRLKYKLGYLHFKLGNIDQAYNIYMSGQIESQVYNYLDTLIQILDQNIVNSISQKEYLYVARLDIDKLEDYELLITIGDLLLRTNRNSEALPYFKKAFSLLKTKLVFQKLFNIYMENLRKQEALDCLRVYLKQETAQLAYYQNTPNQAEICFQLCSILKVVAIKDQSILKNQLFENLTLTLQDLYYEQIKQAVKHTFSRKRICNAEVVFQLLRIEQEKGNYLEVQNTLILLINKYPRLSTFLRWKQYCLTRHGPIKEQCECKACEKNIITKVQNEFLFRFFLAFDIEEEQQSIQAMRKWSLQYLEQQKHKSKTKIEQFVDAIALLTAVEAKNKDRAGLLKCFKYMLQDVYKKSAAALKTSKELISFYAPEGTKGTALSQAKRFKQSIQGSSQQNQNFLIRIISKIKCTE